MPRGEIFVFHYFFKPHTAQNMTNAQTEPIYMHYLCGQVRVMEVNWRLSPSVPRSVLDLCLQPRGSQASCRQTELLPPPMWISHITTNLSIWCVNVALSPSLQDIWVIKARTTNYSNLKKA